MTSLRSALLSVSLLVGCGGASEAAPTADAEDAAVETPAADAPPDDAAADAPTEAPGDAPTDAPPPKRTTALLRPADPLPCADPAVVSEKDAGKVFYVYCTGMAHVWKTTDWVTFSDVRAGVKLDLAGLSANGKSVGAWWAPGVAFSKARGEYVMWVSVPDADATKGADGWDTRSLAVLRAPAPDGPWTFAAIAIDAKVGQHFIDPFLFVDGDGLRYVYWKQYGGGVPSSIMGARVDPTFTDLVAGTAVEIMNGYGGPGTWEDNVRENPAVRRDAAGRYHLLFSGGHWADGSYATGHALSTCGPLCPPSTAGGWHMVDSGDRGILHVVRAFGNKNFTQGGPGGAEFLGDVGERIVYAAAARSASGDATRYLMLDDVAYAGGAPFVDRAGHEPLGF